MALSLATADAPVFDDARQDDLLLYVPHGDGGGGGLPRRLLMGLASVGHSALSIDASDRVTVGDLSAVNTLRVGGLMSTGYGGAEAALPGVAAALEVRGSMVRLRAGEDTSTGAEFVAFANDPQAAAAFRAVCGTDEAEAPHTAEFGCSLASPVFIRHNARERLTIDATGRTGIGTTSPERMLHVVGEALFTEAVTAKTFRVLNGEVMMVEGPQRLTSTGEFTGLEIVHDVRRVLEPDYDTPALRVITPAAGETPALTVAGTDGYVGINTDAPQERLHVVGDVRIEGLGDLRGGIQVAGPEAAPPALHVQATDGFVGVATGSPAAPLDVAGGAVVRQRLAARGGARQTTVVPALYDPVTYTPSLRVEQVYEIPEVYQEDVAAAAPPVAQFFALTTDDLQALPGGAQYREDVIFDSSTSDPVPALMVAGRTGYVGVQTSAPEHALHVVGNIATSGSVITPSDERLKADVRAIPAALDKALALEGCTFVFAADGPGARRRTGLIAQQVQQVMPEAVTESPTTGHLSVAYGELVGLVLQAIKELNAKVDAALLTTR